MEISPVTAFHYTFGPSVSELHDMTCVLTERLSDAGCKPREIFILETALEELVTNAIKYGLTTTEDPTIDIVVEKKAEALVLVMRDNGRPFDNVSDRPEQPPTSLERMSAGGLGLHMVHELSQEVSYQRDSGWNQTTVTIEV